MTIERKTELGRDLQWRADVCQVLLGGYMTSLARARLDGKAQAYSHAAELADASEPAPDESGVDEYDRHRDAKIAHAAELADAATVEAKA